MTLPKYVHRDTDRYGTVRYYYRPPGRTKLRLSDDPASPEFAQAIAARDAETAEAEGRPQKVLLPTQPGTLRWLCDQYFASPTFAALDPRTQHVRKLVIEHCLREPTAPGADTTFAVFPLAMVTTKALKVLRDRKLKTPAAANTRIKCFRGIYSWAMEAEVDGVTINPAREVKFLKGRTEGFHAWTLEEIERFEERHPLGSKGRLALALLLYTGQRRSDVVLMGRQHLKDGWLRFTQFKNRNKKPIRLEIPVLPELARIISLSPVGDMTFLVTGPGNPFTSNGFGNWFRDQCDAAGLTNCSAHGLRKAAAGRLAELGCTDREIMSITGHVTSKEVDRYTKGADQRRLAENVLRRFKGKDT